MDAHTESSIRVALGRGGLVVATTTERCLQIILADPTGDGAGVEADMLALYYTETDERARQFDADLLEKGMGRV